ncbi:potassium channel family protein [Methanomethylophilus alvi]|nr:TrkA C-terminal domain-containing protein [Methanomethylophilus alvi]MCI5974321.1 potassium transporter TrkA [Methanomethylophilus alvi]MDY7060745.1 TrkA C-terminal domain-containing protein [Methanomethylophilus alvi]CDF30253.1 trkA-C domain protein [Methanoculleus sp. CAG:1088]
MTVRELLTEMKDTSEVIIDLAYASLMYNSSTMAEKVRGLEDDMDDLKFATRYKVLLSSRTREDARQLSGILEVASAADRISDAASDIVSLLRFPPEKRPFITEMLSEADEKIRMIKISSDSSMVGNTIGRLQIEASTGCKIIAIKNRRGWTYDPEDEMKLRANDVIIVRGTDDGADLLVEYAAGRKEWEFEEIVPDDVIEDEAEEDLQNEEELSEEIRGEGDEE